MGTRGTNRRDFRTFLIAAALAVTLAGCASTQDLIGQQEDQLSAAGFVQRPANSPEREAMLKRLPPNQFVRRVNGDEVTYVYGDPVVCNCLYVGTQQAYGQYVRYVQAKRLVNEQRQAAMMFNDPAWNWGAWGPWGPRYGFHTGFGW
ncbi:MAG TPA: hypothetical protein VN718_08790 [Rhizomicrobium sp.]|nr:hypothetical protein [Rhizomicrobium sp.]